MLVHGSISLQRTFTHLPKHQNKTGKRAIVFVFELKDRHHRKKKPLSAHGQDILLEDKVEGVQK